MAKGLLDLTADDGLHLLKDKWGQQVENIEEQAAYLARHLDKAIQATIRSIPRRRQGYFTVSGRRKSGASVKLPEGRWQDAVFQRWSTGDNTAVRDCWDRVIFPQVPLQGTQRDSRWGKVDLLGLRDKIPVVIELKADPKIVNGRERGRRDSPLRMVLEALAYSVAIRENWKVFREDLRIFLDSMSQPADVPQALTTVRLVGLAPDRYWLQWVPLTARGHAVSAGAWEAFRELLAAIEGEGLQVSFATIRGRVDRWRQMQARVLNQFPLG